MSVIVELDERTAAVVQALAAGEQRSASEVIHDALAAWAADEFRSVNGHIEWVLREGLKRAGRKVVPRASDLPELPVDGAPTDAVAESHGEPQADGA